MILREYPDTCLHIVGKGLRRKILQEKAKKLGIIGNITFHGNVPSKELVNLYRNCFVFYHSSFADGWNQPALEAMASGRPVICTDAVHNSMVEHKKTGFKVPFGDSDILSEKILELFSNYKLGEKMGVEGRKKAEEEHNWEKIADDYYKVFCKVV